MIEKVVIPAAGNGTRMFKAGADTPKELLPLGGKLMIDYAVEEALSSQVPRVGIVINERKERIREHLTKAYGVDFNYIYQERPLGLGDAIRSASGWIDDAFGVILPDELLLGETPALLQLIRAYEKYGASVIGVKLERNVKKYGLVFGEEVEPNIFLVKDLEEKPSHFKFNSGLVIVGRYVLSEEILHLINRVNERTGEIELTDGLKKLLLKEEVYAIIVDGRRLDCGYLEGYKRCIETLGGDGNE